MTNIIEDGYRMEKKRRYRSIMERWLIENDPQSKYLERVNGILQLKQTTIVHHINMDKSDDRIENLRCFEGHEAHSRHHGETGYKKRNPLRTKKSKKKPSLSLTSYGTRKIQVLRHLNNIRGARFNIRAFSKESQINRSTIYSSLQSLEKEKLLEKIPLSESVYHYSITEQGIKYLENMDKNRGFVSLRREVGFERLSTHFFKYSLKISDTQRERLGELGANSIKSNPLPNFTEHYLYFNDATITVKLKQAIIHIHDIESDDIDEAHKTAFDKCMAYILKFKTISKVEGLRVYGKPHYARVQSYLSKKLSKIDNQYRLKFSDGTSFWIDYSDKREDETDSADYRERIDDFFMDLKGSKSLLSDVDKHDLSIEDLKILSVNIVKGLSDLKDISHSQSIIVARVLEIFKPTKSDEDKDLSYFG